MSEPWWYPKLKNAEPDDDEDDGCKYRVLWDNLKDAYEQFEALADAYLDARARIAALEARLERAERELRAWREAEDTFTFDEERPLLWREARRIRDENIAAGIVFDEKPARPGYHDCGEPAEEP